MLSEETIQNNARRYSALKWKHIHSEAHMLILASSKPYILKTDDLCSPDISYTLVCSWPCEDRFVYGEGLQKCYIAEVLKLKPVDHLLVVHRDLSSHTVLVVKVYWKTLKIHYFANVTSPFKLLQQFPQGCCWSSMGQEVSTWQSCCEDLFYSRNKFKNHCYIRCTGEMS